MGEGRERQACSKAEKGMKVDGGRKTLRKCGGDRTRDEEVSRREGEKNQRRGET